MSNLLVVNTNTQQSTGNDTNFEVLLRKDYTFRQLSLVSFSMTNVFSNFGIGQTDFSYETSSGLKTITISQIFLSSPAQFLLWINAQTTDVFSIAINFNIFTITCSQAWSPVGEGWFYKAGFLTEYPTRGLANTQIANTYFDFTQSNYIFVRFLNLMNNYQGAEGSNIFRIPLAGISTFGQVISYDIQNLENTQKMIFRNPQSVNSLQIQLLDENYQLLQTNNGNNTQVGLQMIFNYE